MENLIERDPIKSFDDQNLFSIVLSKYNYSNLVIYWKKNDIQIVYDKYLTWTYLY